MTRRGRTGAPPPSARQRAADAHRLANDLAGDLLAGVKCYDLLVTDLGINQRLTTTEHTGALRLCIFHLAVSLAKYHEFYRHYAAVLPADVRGLCRAIDTEVRARRALDFRNTIAGHVWDRRTRRPIPTADVMDRLSDLCRGNVNDFLEWVGRSEADGFPGTVVSVLAHTRTRIWEEHQLTHSDMRDHQAQFPRV